MDTKKFLPFQLSDNETYSLENPQTSTKAVYVAEFSDGVIKVGISQDVERRKKELPTDRKNKLGTHIAIINQFWNTDYFTGETSQEIESNILLNFQSSRLNNSEYLKINTNDAFNLVKTTVEQLLQKKGLKTKTTICENKKRINRELRTDKEAAILTKVDVLFRDFWKVIETQDEFKDYMRDLYLNHDRLKHNEYIQLERFYILSEMIDQHLDNYQKLITDKILDIIVNGGKEILEERGYTIIRKTEI